MQESAVKSKVESQNEVDFSGGLKIEGEVKMKMKMKLQYLAVTAALGAAVITVSLP